MTYRPRAIPKNDRITVEQARTQLVMMLAGCTDKALEAMTVDALATSYRVPRQELEYRLVMAKQKRAAR